MYKLFLSHDQNLYLMGTVICHSRFFFFFLNQQFITQHAKADCGSYFRNYVHDTQTNMKMERK